MTALVVALAATCVTLGLLLVCALVGYSEVVDELRTRLDRAEAENDDLTNELRHQARGNHPAGRGLALAPCPHHPADCDGTACAAKRRADALAQVEGSHLALAEALTERDAEHDGGGDA